jgi:hypothetical protein
LKRERFSELPEDRKRIGTIWMFKMKRIGYQDRLVTKGYNQQVGMDLIAIKHLS